MAISAQRLANNDSREFVLACRLKHFIANNVKKAKNTTIDAADFSHKRIKPLWTYRIDAPVVNH